MRPIYYLVRAKKDIESFPDGVQKEMLHGLYLAQHGGKHPDAKPLKGFGGAGVLEQVSSHHGDTYRSVYTIRFGKAIYVLHAFQKKSRKGISTPKDEIDLIKRRLQLAEQHYKEHHL